MDQQIVKCNQARCDTMQGDKCDMVSKSDTKVEVKVLMNIPVIPANMSEGDRLQIRRFLNIGFHCETFLISGKT